MNSSYSKSVFINCPFSDDFRKIFHAYVFSVIDLGFLPRCALEIVESSDIRLQKIERIIEDCKFGIHDLSNMELDKTTQLPRFNMPLELGLFLGAKRFGDDVQKKKRIIILDSDKYRYQKAISDISGQDIQAHNADDEGAVRCVRDWLQTASNRKKQIPGASHLIQRYRTYQADAPRLCAAMKLGPSALTFSDLRTTMIEWQKASAIRP